MSSDGTTAPEKASTEMIERLLPLRMVSTAIRGYGRGSSDLGIPTANLDSETLKMASVKVQDEALVKFESFPTGIYWGFCRIGTKNDGSGNDAMGVVYKAAISIGYNPTYGNEQKTIEPHLIAPSSDPRRHASSTGETVLQDFYGQPIRLSLVGYLRPELPFEGLEKLVEAIKKDIRDTEELGESTDDVTVKEKAWVDSNESL